jgi:hypothetical protein
MTTRCATYSLYRAALARREKELDYAVKRLASLNAKAHEPNATLQDVQSAHHAKEAVAAAEANVAAIKKIGYRVDHAEAVRAFGFANHEMDGARISRSR